MRDCAPQTWPLFMSPDMTISLSSVSSSTTSSRTIAADLPPSSSVTRFSCSPQTDAMCLPTAVLPVKLTLSTPG